MKQITDGDKLARRSERGGDSQPCSPSYAPRAAWATAVWRWRAACVALLLLAAAPLSAAAEGRVAMILAAETYKNYPDSPVRGEQLEQVAAALRSLDFEVEIVTNANNASSRAALRNFVARADGAALALVVLAGHVAEWRGVSFFLPANIDIRRPTDLLSHGVSVDAVARSAQKAERGAVFFLTTFADLPSTLQGVNARPAMKAAPSENVVIALSSSGKIPVSQMNNVARQAASDLVQATAEPDPTLAILVDSVSAGGAGIVVGEIPELSFNEEAPPEPEPEPVDPVAETEAETEVAAEDPAAPETEIEVAAAPTPPTPAPLPVEPAEPETAVVAAPEPLSPEESVEPAPAAPEPEPAAPAAELDPALQAFIATLQDAQGGDVESLQLIEALLGRPQRSVVQLRLKVLGLYDGRIDAVFGPQTRRAIRDFQDSRDEPVTGYLTPDQLMVLISTDG